MPNSQAPAHWSKDFVEHLRTIHFTLMALCVGLLVLASFPSKTEIQLAHEQASEILEVVNTWKTDIFETESQNVVRKEAAYGAFGVLTASNRKPLLANFELMPRA